MVSSPFLSSNVLVSRTESYLTKNWKVKQKFEIFTFQFQHSIIITTRERHCRLQIQNSMRICLGSRVNGADDEEAPKPNRVKIVFTVELD